jgi:hypothetical protein
VGLVFVEILLLQSHVLADLYEALHLPIEMVPGVAGFLAFCFAVPFRVSVPDLFCDTHCAVLLFVLFWARNEMYWFITSFTLELCLPIIRLPKHGMKFIPHLLKQQKNIFLNGK